MHAIVGIFKMDPAHHDLQIRELHERIVPMTRHQPGFVSGVWSMDPSHTRSIGYVVFQTESAAKKMAEFVREHNARPNPAGVELESLTVVEVVAEARA